MQWPRFSKPPGSDPTLLKAAGLPCLAATSGELLTASIQPSLAYSPSSTWAAPGLLVSDPIPLAHWTWCSALWLPSHFPAQLGSDLVATADPSGTWLLTIFLFLLDAAPPCITLTSPISTFHTKLYLCVLTHAGPSAGVPFPPSLETRTPDSCPAYLNN